MAKPTETMKPTKAASSSSAAKTTTAPAVRQFVHDDDKFWEVVVVDKTLKTRHGKIGSPGQTKLKQLASAAAAIAEYDRAVAAKLKDGYVERGSANAIAEAVASGATLDAREPALEKAIENDPYDDQAYSVFADWLQDQGDPRGELIALQLAGKTKQAKTLLAKHESYFLGPLAAHPKCYDNLYYKPAKDTFTWKRGFIHGARMSYASAWRDEINNLEGPLVDLLDTVLTHPSARFLTELTLMYNGDHSNDLQTLLDRIAKGVPKTLRKIVIGDEVDQISWYYVGDLSKLWKAVPNLTELYIEAGTFTLGKIDAPSLRKATFKTGGLSAASAKSIATGQFPKLEHLDIYYGDPNYGADCSIDHVTPLLARTDLPALRHLGLTNAAFADEICEALPRSKLLPRLKELDLSQGIMTDAGARHLVEHRDAFAHLELLDVSENYLSAAAVQSLKGLAKKVVATEQKDDDEPEYRSVSIGE